MRSARSSANQHLSLVCAFLARMGLDPYCCCCAVSSSGDSVYHTTVQKIAIYSTNWPRAQNQRRRAASAWGTIVDSSKVLLVGSELKRKLIDELCMEVPDIS